MNKLTLFILAIIFFVFFGTNIAQIVFDGFFNTLEKSTMATYNALT